MNRRKCRQVLECGGVPPLSDRYRLTRKRRNTWNTAALQNARATSLTWLWLASLALFLPPGLAQAHLVTTGMGPVYDGIGHLLMSPDDLVAVVGLSLYAGLRGATAGRRTMFLLPVAWFAGGLAGSMIRNVPGLPAPALSFLVIGVLVAADLRLPANAVAAFAILIGLVHGFFNGAALKQGAGTPGLLGILMMLFVLVALASALVVSLEKPWTRIVVRVLGSWIAASGLLLLGWSLSPRPALNPGSPDQGGRIRHPLYLGLARGALCVTVPVKDQFLFYKFWGSDLDGNIADTKKLEHTVPVTFPKDESFDVGLDMQVQS